MNHQYLDLEKLRKEIHYGCIFLLIPRYGPFYSGLKNPTARTQVEAALIWLDRDSYKNVHCFTYYDSKISGVLPDWKVDNYKVNTTTLGWQIRGESKTKEKKVNVTDSKITLTIGLSSSKRTSMVSKDLVALDKTHQTQNGIWLERIKKLLQHLEKICGLQWKSNEYIKIADPEPSLIIIQDSWFLLNENNTNERVGTVPQSNTFSDRYKRILSYAKKNKITIAIICSERGLIDYFHELGKTVSPPYISLQFNTSDENRTNQKLEEFKNRARTMISIPIKDFESVEKRVFTIPTLHDRFCFGKNYDCKNDGGNKAFFDVFNPFHKSYRETEPIVAKDPLSAFDSFIGMEELKQKMKDLHRVASMPEFNEKLHFLLEGNPGTGKTVIAKVIAETLFKLNLIKTNKFTSVTLKDLKSNVVGGSAKDTQSVIENAYNGVLFIDEAHAFKPDGAHNFDKEVISTMLPYMQNREHFGKIVFIFAGYPKDSNDNDDVRDLFKIDSGLARRIPEDFRFTLPNYSSKELVEIFGIMAKQKNISLPTSNEFLLSLEQKFDHCRQEHGERQFGNAGRAMEFLTSIRMKIAPRKEIRIGDLEYINI